MWSFMTQPGPATAVLEVTHDFSLLGVSLLSLMALSIGPIAWVAIRHYLSQDTKPTGGVAATSYRKAA
jgi:hypothetical protein